MLRPYILNDDSGPSSSKAPLHTVHDTESIREFWGETDVGAAAEQEEQEEGGEGRLEHMRARTGKRV